MCTFFKFCPSLVKYQFVVPSLNFNKLFTKKMDGRKSKQYKMTER